MQVREFDLRSLDKMLPCPFCGGEAELDTHQAYAQIANGKIGHRVVVYCTDCGADQGTCVEDVPDIHPNEVIERWNKRGAMPQRELLAEALGALAPMTRGLKEADYYCPDDVAEDHTVLISASIAELREARAAADKIRAALTQEKQQ